MLLFAYHLAARRGEIFRSKWSDIDFKNTNIRLWTRKRKGGDLEFDWIPLTKELRGILLSWWEERMSQPTIDKEHIFVCPNDLPVCDFIYGEPYKNRQHFMKRLCKKAKVKPFGFHAIRHLSATVQYHNGKDLNWLQAFLRHKNATTTEKYLKKLGLKPLSNGLEEGFKRSADIIDLSQKKTSKVGSFEG